MIGFQYFASIPTTIELNGPVLSFAGSNTLQPISTSVCDGGTVVLTGFATAFFPTQSPTNPAQNSGSIAYRWYEVGVGPLTDSVNITGTATTVLTLSNLVSPTDSSKQYFLRADYTPSAYAIGKSTGNAINDTLDSNSVTVTVNPTISITNQPDDAETAVSLSQKFEVTANSTDYTQGSLSYRWLLNGVDLSDSPTVSGSASTSLSISSSTVGVNTVQVRVSHPTSCNSPILSRVAAFNVVTARNIINFESISSTEATVTESTATLSSWNLFSQGEVTIDADSFNNFSLLSFYAPEKDITVEMDIYARKGLNNGSFVGGEGGFSRIRFTMRQNEEFVFNHMFKEGTFLTVTIAEAGQFLYKKGRLIACVGAGGNAGTSGNGGFGGGINVGGGNGSGSGGGAGGVLYAAGTLPSTGIFGSAALFSPKATAPLGGRCLPCPTGGSNRPPGIGPCDDLGTSVQLRLSPGTLFTNTAFINRGFKSGGGIRQTAGLGLSGGGNGGAGATGGNGGNGGGGGGGASGYTDGSVTVVSTQQGGSTGNPKVIIRLV